MARPSAAIWMAGATSPPQSGAGVVPANFGLSSNNGAMTSLTTHGSTNATTNWNYAGPTGFLTSKTYAGSSGPDFSYLYNQKLQLEHLNRPGSQQTISYDQETGEWAGSDYNDGQLSYSVNERDIMGRVKELEENAPGTSWITNFAFTAQNQLKSETLPQFTGAAFNTFYEYYGTGESTGAASPGAAKNVAIRDGAQDAVKQSYSYDEAGKRLNKITAGSGNFIYDYFPGTDLIHSITAPNGVIITYVYERNTGRLSAVNSMLGSQTLYSISYGYYDNDQRASAQVEFMDANGQLQTQQWDFDYDAQDQLIFAKAYHSDEPITGLEFNYDFDAVGNHLESGWTINLSNQVTHAPAVSGNITYDDRGNVSFDGHFHYTWDAEDHLIEAHNTVAKFTFGYDSQGRRIWKQSYGWVNNDWALGEHLVFAYDGWNLLAEYRVVGNNSPQLYRSYAWGQSLGGGIGGLLSITDHTATGGPKTYFPFYDGNGNITGLTDTLGQIAATYQYDPFGKLISSAGPAAQVNPFLFSTKYYDADTQLYYFGYRYYCPEMQRWLSRDPIEEDGGLNLYAFVGNDPVNRVDAVGLDSILLPTKSDDWDWRIENEDFKSERAFRVQLGRALTVPSAWNKNLAQEACLRIRKLVGSEGVLLARLYDNPEIYQGINFARRDVIGTVSPESTFRWILDRRVMRGSSLGTDPRLFAEDVQDLISYNESMPYSGFDAYMMAGHADDLTQLALGAVVMSQAMTGSRTPGNQSALRGRVETPISGLRANGSAENGARIASARLAGSEAEFGLDTIPSGQRIILRPVEIRFPSKGLSPLERQMFAAHLSEQEMTLNRLSLNSPNELQLNLLNAQNIKPQLSAARALARQRLSGVGSGLDAAHSLDSVAGGYVHEFAGLRNPIQQKIGALWRTRAEQIVPGREHRLVPDFKD